MSAARLGACVTLAMIAAACGEGAAPEPLGSCTAAPRITVTGVDPTVDWSPRCTVRRLDVAPLLVGLSGSRHWSVGARDTFEIAPPVRYGVLPPNAVEFTAPRALGRDTTFVASASTARIGPIIMPGVEARSAPFTACVTASGAGCRVTPEVVVGTTASGVRIGAALDRSAITRGETATATVTYENPGAEPVTLQAASGCGPAYPETYLNGVLRGVFDANCFASPVPTLTVPARGRTTQQFRTTAVFPRLDGQSYCPDAGAYVLRFVTRDFVGGLRVASNELRLTVRESAALAPRCIPVP